MVKELKLGLMATNMKETGEMANLMDKESLLIQTGKQIKENGPITYKMAKEKRRRRMALAIRANLRTVKKMATENT